MDDDFLSAFSIQAEQLKICFCQLQSEQPQCISEVEVKIWRLQENSWSWPTVQILRVFPCLKENHLPSHLCIAPRFGLLPGQQRGELDPEH